MASKIKAAQIETPNESQSRDNFQTPNYAIDLLIPYIPRDVQWVWEPACGEGKIANRLLKNKFGVFSSDILPSNDVRQHFDFLSSYNGGLAHCIITNPPFSLKRKFFAKCLEYGVPFALLIPADYSGWIIDAIRNGAEKLIPSRRVDYITPSGLSRATGHTSNCVPCCETCNRAKLEMPLEEFLCWIGKVYSNMGNIKMTFVNLSLEEIKNNI